MRAFQHSAAMGLIMAAAAFGPLEQERRAIEKTAKKAERHSPSGVNRKAKRRQAKLARMTTRKNRK